MRPTAIAIVSLLFLAGCESGGAVLNKMFGPPDVQPIYVPDKKQPILVLVENYRSGAVNDMDADLIAQQVSSELKEHNVAPIIDNDTLINFRDTQANHFHEMTIPAVGKAVGAKQVVYVDLVQSSVQADRSMATAQGEAIARIRVVDVATGETRWPLDSQSGYLLSAKIPYDTTDPERITTLRARLLNQLSSSIAKLFYPWQPETERESNTDND